MNHYCFDDIAHSEKIVVASLAASFHDKVYELKHKEYPDIHIPNRGFAHSLSFEDDHSEKVESVKRDVKEYNEYLTRLEAIPNFLEFFQEHGFCVSRADVAAEWSEEVAEVVFSKKSYCFSTEITQMKGYLFDNSIPVNYQVQIGADQVVVPIGEPSDAYPKEINGRKAIWNWVDNGHDFCYFLWELLGARYTQSEDSDDENGTDYYVFDAYNQTRDGPTEPQLRNIFRKLESLGYLETYTIKVDREDPRWAFFGKSDGTIDLAVVDTSFLRNSLLKEQIELLLWQPTDSITDGQCFLTDSNGKQYISDHRGAIGGHNKLKIYGRLDCPSAARYIAKGKYIRHRVFFADEEVAIAAGYRPCSVCMREAYKRLKNTQR